MQELFIGDFEIKVNGEEYGTIQDSSVTLDINQILETVSNLNTIEIAFKTSGVNPLVISQYTIPVISGASAYSVTLENPGTIFEANEDGVVSSHTITTKAHVYYGLQELEYLSETGWEYGLIEAPAGFTVNVDAISGVISITNETGNIPEYGKIKIPVFIRSQTNTEYTVGYESGARAVVQMYVGYDENYEGYLTPDESGFFDAYFTWQKLTETAIKLHELSDTVEGYWNVLTNDLKITIPEKNVLRRTLEGFTAEFTVYANKYSACRNYAAYKSVYSEISESIENILQYDGVYSFNSQEERNAFNKLFETYYAKRGLLDSEIASTDTNFTGVNTVNLINSYAQTAKPGDYFVWVGDQEETVGGVTFKVGMTYKWEGTEDSAWWVEDNNNEHMMATMSETLAKIENSKDETIPAVVLTKRLAAMQVLADTVMTKDLIIKNILRSENVESLDSDEKGFYFDKDGNTKINDLIAKRIKATDGDFTGKVTATSGTFNGIVNAIGGEFNNVGILGDCEIAGLIGTNTLEYSYDSVNKKLDYYPANYFNFSDVVSSDILFLYESIPNTGEGYWRYNTNLVGVYVVTTTHNERFIPYSKNNVIIIDKVIGPLLSNYTIYDNGSLNPYIKFSLSSNAATGWVTAIRVKGSPAN